MGPSLEGRRFAAAVDGEGDVDRSTVFEYHQEDDLVWARYEGGAIRRGFLVGLRVGDELHFRYSHLTRDGETATGRCHSRLQDSQGGLRLLERWQWDSKQGSGTSVLEELRTVEDKAPVHPLAARGYAVAAEAYERGRPGYPMDLLARAADRIGLRSGQRVLDLGAGTGKLTRGLLELGLEVVAVEPVDEMRQLLARELASVTALDGTAQAIPLPDGSVSAVFAGEAFHWFAEPAAMAEIERVLTFGGGLGLLWNVAVWEDELHPWFEDLRRVLRDHREEKPLPYRSVRSGEWRQVVERSGFGPLELDQALHQQELSLDDFLAQASSWSFVAALGERARSAALADVRALIEPYGPRVTVRWRADAYTCRLDHPRRGGREGGA